MLKTNKLLKIVVINTMIFVVLLKIVDLFLQEDDQPNKINVERKINLKEFSPDIDFWLTPDDHYLTGTENLTQKPYRVRTDANGYIIGPDDFLSKTDSIEIFFFGGSTTECEFVDEEKRFPYLVGQILSQKIGKRITVRNAGVSGKNTVLCTLDLISKGIPLNPKIVVLMENINDLSHLTKTANYWKGPGSRSILIEHSINEDSNELYNIFRSIKNIICPNIYNRMINLLLTPQEADAIPVDEWEGFRNYNSSNYLDIEKQYANAILSFISLAKVYNIEVVLMTQFNRINLKDNFIADLYHKNMDNFINGSFENEKLDFGTFVNFYTMFNEKIRDISKREDLLLIDLADSIPSTKKYIYDAVHLNNAGSLLAAEIIAREIGSKFYQLN